MTKKQKVLAIRSEHVDWLYQRRRFYELQTLSSASSVFAKAEYVDRQWAETTTDVKQLIACAIIANKHKLLCARRSRNSNRSALALRWTILFGGHVDDEDRDSENPLANCVCREIFEELGFKPSPLNSSVWSQIQRPM